MVMVGPFVLTGTTPESSTARSTAQPRAMLNPEIRRLMSTNSGEPLLLREIVKVPSFCPLDRKRSKVSSHSLVSSHDPYGLRHDRWDRLLRSLRISVGSGSRTSS